MMNEIEKINFDTISAALNVSKSSVEKWFEFKLKTQEANEIHEYERNDDFNKYLDLTNKIEIGKSQFSRSFILFMTDRIAYFEQFDEYNSCPFGKHV